jgi:hypothetical protein
MTAPRPTPTEAEVRERFARITEALAGSTPSRPASRHQVSNLTGFKTQPTGDDLDTIEAIYVEEGFRDVEAVPAQGQSGRGWDVAVFASNNPYEGGGGQAFDERHRA